jgi:excisionase family DNA binding protein
VPDTETPPEFLTAEQAMEYLGIGRAYLYRVARAQGIPRHKAPVGRKVMFARADLDKLREPKPIEPQPKR